MLADTSNRITKMSENPLSLSAKFCRIDIRKHFFSQRVISPWNDLPCDIKTAPTLNTFQSRYDKYVKISNLVYFVGTKGAEKRLLYKKTERPNKKK